MDGLSFVISGVRTVASKLGSCHSLANSHLCMYRRALWSAMGSLYRHVRVFIYLICCQQMTVKSLRISASHVRGELYDVAHVGLSCRTLDVEILVVLGCVRHKVPSSKPAPHECVFLGFLVLSWWIARVRRLIMCVCTSHSPGRGLYHSTWPFSTVSTLDRSRIRGDRLW